MATTLSANLLFGCTATETLDDTVYPGITRNKITHSGFNAAFALTTSAVSILSEITLSGASGSIDLTTLTTTTGTQSASGKKLKFIRINNRSATARTFTLAVGASNGYVIGGVTFNVPAGGAEQKYYVASLAAIDGTHKTLDWTFNADSECDVTLVLG